ncbi:hypothetical protein ABIC02_007391 [Bradyrhizobium sp. RT5a]
MAGFLPPTLSLACLHKASKSLIPESLICSKMATKGDVRQGTARP